MFITGLFQVVCYKQVCFEKEPLCIYWYNWINHAKKLYKHDENIKWA